MSTTTSAPDGLVKVVDFAQSINLDNVNENIYPFDDGVAPHLENTGILRDNGVTNLYQTTTTDAGTYDQVFYAGNGKKLGIAFNGTEYATISVDNRNIPSSALGRFSINDVNL